VGFLTSLLGQSTVQAVGAGVLSGALGGAALMATGVIPIPPETVTQPTIQLLACPGQGPVLAEVSEGERLLVTAKSADGQWLEVYIGQPGIDRAWTEAPQLSLETPADDLPVADCAAPTPAPLPSPAPTQLVTEAPTAPPTLGPSATPEATESASPTPAVTATATAKPSSTPKPTKTPSPTPKPTKTPTPPPPTPTPTPTPTPDTTGPTLTNLQTTGGSGGNGDYYINGPSSACEPHSASITVTATDPSGVDHITLFYWPGNSGVLSKQMTGNGNSWGATINAQDSWSDSMFNEDPNGLISYWVVAEDEAGNSRQLDHTNQFRLYSNGVCLL
jgi:hypothetical protein